LINADDAAGDMRSDNDIYLDPERIRRPANTAVHHNSLTLLKMRRIVSNFEAISLLKLSKSELKTEP